MAREFFETYSPGAKAQETILHANVIISEYQAMGFKLTLRQLYYQFVARGLLENKQQNYKNLGATISKARLAGLIDWDAMEDRTRSMEGASWGYRNVAHYISRIANGYLVDWWKGQECYLEFWPEKEALAGVVESACEPWRVGYMCCRGNVSQSEMYAAGKRMADMAARGKSCHVFHLGDHDPNGIDMTRDNRERLELMSNWNVEFHRIALTMDQIEELAPPPNPSKDTDTRFDGYKEMMAEYGYTDPDDIPSWELDALTPDYITSLINEQVEKYIDFSLFSERQDLEREGELQLQKVADNWTEIEAFIADLG
jgi:hypothetical protein